MGVRVNFLRNFRLLFVVIFLLIPWSVYASGLNIHIVKKGETLIGIARKKLGPPVFRPKSGSLALLIKLNKQIEDQDKIYPGEKIVIVAKKRKLASSENVAAAKSTSSQGLSNQVAQTEPINNIRFLGGYQFTSLKASDFTSGSSADLQTSYDFLASLMWSQNWSDELSTYEDFGLRKINFQPSTNPTKTLTGTAKNLFHLKTAISKKISSHLWFNFGASYDQELFLHALSGSVVNVDAVSVPKLSAGLKLDIIKKNSLSFGLETSANYLFAASSESFSIKSGRSFAAGFYVQSANKKKQNLEIHIGVNQRAQDTSIISIKETSVYGTVAYSFPFFEPEGVNEK